MKHQVIGKLVGNTGDPRKIMMVMNSSMAGRRGEFVRIAHQELEDEATCDVLGRIVSITRANALFDSGMGNSVYRSRADAWRSNDGRDHHRQDRANRFQRS